MTTRFPLTLNTSTTTIEELPSGVDLSATGGNIIADNFIGNVSSANIIGTVANANYANFAGNAFSVAGSNVVGPVAFATTANAVAGANVSGEVANANYATFAGTAFSVAGSNVVGPVAFATTANSVAGANVSGTVANAAYALDSGNSNVANTVLIAAQPNITSLGTLTSLAITGTANLGNIANVKILGGSNLQLIQTDGTGNLSFVAPPSSSQIANGNSNVNIPAANGNVNISVTGVANVVQVSNTALTINGKIITPAIVAIGDASTSGSTGSPGIAIGHGAACGAFGISLRVNSTAFAATAINGGVTSTASYGVSIGDQCGVSGQRSVAIGRKATVSGANAIAIGNEPISNAEMAISLGNIARATTTKAVAIGAYANATGGSAVALGSNALANTTNSIVINGTGTDLGNPAANSFVVKPVRQNKTTSSLFYDTTSGEISSAIVTYGEFTSNVTQTNPVANAVNYMTLNNTEEANGISIVSNSQITIARTGVYDVQFSAQLKHTVNQDANVEIWITKNGTALANTNTRLTLVKDQSQIAAWDWLVTAGTANDYFQLAWASSDTSMTLPAVDTANTIAGVAIPSVIVTVTPVGA